MFSLAIAISMVGVIKFLIILALIVLFILGVKWLLEKLGWSVPPAMWAVIGFIVILLLILVIVSGGAGVTLT